MNSNVPWSLVFFLAFMSLAASGQEPGEKISKGSAKRLIADFVGLDDKKRDAARKRLEAVRAEDRPAVFEALAARKFVAPKSARRFKKGLHVEEVALEPPLVKTGLFDINVPKKYSKKKPMPVLFRFHGSGDSGAEFARWWYAEKLADTCLTVTPTIPTADRQAWNSSGVRSFVDRVYRFMLENFNVDTNRVYLSGYSAGGAASAIYAQDWPHRVAAIFSMGRVMPKYHLDWEGCFAVLSDIPGFYAIGLADKKDRVDGYRQAEEICKKNGYPSTFHFVERREHEYMRQFDEPAAKFMFDNVRTSYPKSFNAFFYTYTDFTIDQPFTNRQHWLYSDTCHPPVRARVSIDGNDITIDGKLKSGSVVLNDSLVDLDQPVTITVDGKKVFEGLVERSIPFLLDWYAEHRDPNWLFWNRVDF